MYASRCSVPLEDTWFSLTSLWNLERWQHRPIAFFTAQFDNEPLCLIADSEGPLEAVMLLRFICSCFISNIKWKKGNGKHLKTNS